MSRLAKINLLCFCAFLLSCTTGTHQNSRPTTLLSEDAFVDLLVNFSLSESAYNLNLYQVKNLNFDSVYAFNPLLEKQIRKSQYDSTLLYYSSNITEYKLVYEKVLDRLNSLQAKGQGSLTPQVQ